jgi:hypothetical protein
VILQFCNVRVLSVDMWDKLSLCRVVKDGNFLSWVHEAEMVKIEFLQLLKSRDCMGKFNQT